MGHRLVQILEKFAHAGHRDAEGLHEQQQLLGLQVLQGWGRLSLSHCHPVTPARGAWRGTGPRGQLQVWLLGPQDPTLRPEAAGQPCAPSSSESRLP